MTGTITNTEDLIDIREVIERFEELENDKENASADFDEEEYQALDNLLLQLKGSGGDEEWRGDWYPIMLIRETYFETYAEQLAEDCGDLDENPRWPYTCIDWERAAKELQYDYAACEFEGIIYYYR